MNDALSGLRRLIGRPVQERFNAAVPSHRGDRLLLSLIGQISSNRGVAEQIYGEGETFLIKGALFLTGVRMDPSAFEGVGDRWKEDLGQAHFNPNARRAAQPAAALRPLAAPRPLHPPVPGWPVALPPPAGAGHALPLPGGVASLSRGVRAPSQLL